MKRVPFAMAAALLLGGLPLVHGDNKDAVKQLMERKLEHSHKILSAIALGEPDKIEKHANELLIISKTADFKVIKTPQYELFANAFRDNAEALIKSAKDNNIDAASLAYVEMTLTCVKCHKYVREVRMALLD